MVGLIGRKIGMTQVFDERGVLTPVTVIKIEENQVVGERNEAKNGYNAVLLGAVDGKEKHITKPIAGQFGDLTPKRHLVEMRDFEGSYEIGKKLGAELFKDISFVDIQGVSKGKGYQGVMKRHGFGGGRKTHGSKFHRGLGATGMAADPSKIHKGTKMPGRMGGEKSTVQNLRVIRVDEEKQFLLVKGAVPGPRKGIVIVSRAKKK
ncbi:MAG: 50S ribosomal protein L3 [Spirochaetaceae bacterium]